MATWSQRCTQEQGSRTATSPRTGAPGGRIVEASIEDVRFRTCLLARTARDESLQVAGGLHCPLGWTVAGGEMDVAAEVCLGMYVARSDSEILPWFTGWMTATERGEGAQSKPADAPDG